MTLDGAIERNNKYLIGQGYEGMIYQNRDLVQSEVTNKPPNTYKSESDLDLITMPIKVKISLLNLAELELCMVIRTDLEKSVAMSMLKDIIKTAIRETISQRLNDCSVEV